MGKPTGFLDYERVEATAVSPKERIKNFNEFHTPLSEDEQRKQSSRCMDCGVPFCQSGMTIKGMTSGCPLNNLIPEWNDLLYTGNWEQAYHRLHKTSNFPEFTSRVCPALCEKACTCGLNGKAVCTKENEMAIIEHAYAKGYAKANPPKVRTKKRIAVVGSGPAGLAVADQLNQRGHSVTVYERADRIGGLLRYGIPNMKLEKHIIDRKLDIMKEEGIEFVTNANVGENIKAKKLMADYDAVVLACGAANPRDINAPGRDANGIYFAVDFLTATTKSLLDSGLKDGRYISAKDKNVIVIGGGNIFRGLSGANKGFDRVKGDQMGMLATVINSLALSSALVAAGVKARVLTAVRMEPIGEFYSKWKAIECMENGEIVIMSAGTGNPFFTTDTGSSLRGIEIEADVMLKGTRVDGIYTADPEKDPTATKFHDITYDEVLKRGLKVMDLTATCMCKENNLPIVVFDMDTVGNLKKVISGEEIGTIVHN